MSNAGFLISFYTLTAILLVTIAVLVRMEYRLSSPAIFFWIAILVIYAVPSLFDPFRESTRIMNGPSLDLRGNLVLLRAHIFAILFCWCYYLVRLCTFPAESKRSGDAVPVPALPAAIRDEPNLNFMLLAGVAVVGVAVLLEILAIVPRAGWSGLLSGTYGTFRLESDPTLKLMGYYLIYAFGGLVFIAWFARHRSLAGAIFLMVFAVFLVGRTRQLLFPAIIPFCLYFIYRARGFKGWLFLGAGVVASYVFILALQIFRYQEGLGAGFTALTETEFYLSIYQALQDEKGEAMIRYIYYYFIEENTVVPEFMHGQTYLRTLLLPIPAALLGGFKPLDYEMVLFQHYFGSGMDIGGTIHPLIFGSAFTNFGWPGILLGGFWALVFHVTNMYLLQRTLLHRILLMSTIGFLSMMIARGSVYNSLAFAFWIILFLEGFFLLFRSFTAAKAGRVVRDGAHTQSGAA